MALSEWFREWKHKHLLFVGVALYVLVFITQTRSLLLAVVIGCAYLCMRYRGARQLALGLGIFVLPTAVLLAATLGFDVTHPLFAVYFDPSLTAGSVDVRAAAADMMLTFLDSEGWVLGKGSLSLLYNGGFASVFGGLYGQYFFLSDLGLLGEFFRFGILYPLLLGVLVYLIVRITPPRGTAYRPLLLAALVVLLSASPLLGTFTMRGEYIGMALAFGWLCCNAVTRPVYVRVGEEVPHYAARGGVVVPNRA